MFPQIYGTQYYGKRFPIKPEKQVFVTAICSSFAEYTRAFLVYVVSTVKCTANFLPKIVNKKVAGTAKCAITATKHIALTPIRAVCNISARAVKLITFSKPIIAACNACASIKKRAYKAIISVATALALVHKYRAYSLEFIGPFKPGDVIKINSKTMELTLNGKNALPFIGKDNFPLIRPGEQTLTYTDNEGERIVKIKIQWKDRWL